MAARNRRQLDCAMAGVQPAYRQRAHPRSAAKVVRPVAPAIATGFAGLDAITGYNGIPLGAITLLCGPVTFGKLTLAYKMLVGAQRSRPAGAAPNVALLNVSGAADPDYLARCGVDLARLRVASPPVGPQVLAALGRMLSDPALRVVVIDSLAELAGQASVRRQFHALLGQLQHHLRATGAALILLDTPSPSWRRWLRFGANSPVARAAALHIEVEDEHWLHRNGELVGYQAQAHLLKSDWAGAVRSAPITIDFGAVVQGA